MENNKEINQPNNFETMYNSPVNDKKLILTQPNSIYGNIQTHLN